jgi:Cys-tRNA(Pro) deacylase
VPANTEKALAKLTGDPKTELVPLREMQPLTGCIRGGVTALACKRNYPVFVDQTAELFDLVSVSAGVRGTQILLAPTDYLAACHQFLPFDSQFASSPPPSEAPIAQAKQPSKLE